MQASPSFRDQWSKAWNKREFRMRAVITLIVLMFLFFFLPRFFNFIQEREGITPNDPLLDLIPPKNLSWITFTLIYGALITALISLSFFPDQLLLTLQAYCILNLLRILCLWCVALDAPPGIINLHDPVVDWLGYHGKLITKDLFFSGHVSTMSLLMLAAVNRKLKQVFFFVTLAVASLIILQHVHYTIDVVTAPLFAWISFRAARFIAV